jgi:hypothetical protein
MKIHESALAQAISAYEKMTIKEYEAAADRIYASQPNMLASVLYMGQLGNSDEHVGYLLQILIVLHLALEISKVNIAVVSEVDQKRELQKLIASINATEGLSESLTLNSVQRYIDQHQEKYAYAFAFHVLTESGILLLESENSKFLTLAALNLVNCIASAKSV